MTDFQVIKNSSDISLFDNNCPLLRPSKPSAMFSLFFFPVQSLVLYNYGLYLQSYEAFYFSLSVNLHLEYAHDGDLKLAQLHEIISVL